MKIIGFVGLPGSGKGEASRVARQQGLAVLVMGDVIRQEAARRGLEATDVNLGRVGCALREAEGPEAVARRILQKARASGEGIADGNHLAFALEYMADVGTVASFRLGWATVPKVPMAMTVEVTDLPSSMRATGVRLLYDAFYPLPTGLRLGGRLGYAARDQIIGGLSAGVNASYDF